LTIAGVLKSLQKKDAPLNIKEEEILLTPHRIAGDSTVAVMSQMPNPQERPSRNGTSLDI